MNPANMAEPIEMLFGMSALVGPDNHVLDGGSGSPKGNGQFWGWVSMGMPTVGL